MQTWFTTFAATVALEILVAALLAPRARRGQVVVVCVALNALTQPLATLWLASSPATPFFVPETAVFLVEAAGYVTVARLGVTRGIVLSAVANGVTLVTAVVLFAG